MICPECSFSTLVYIPDTREVKTEEEPFLDSVKRSVVYRKYKCPSCNTTVTTRESFYMSMKIERN